MKKKQLAIKLNQFLMVTGINWERLPKRDLIKLHEAFSRLKADVEELFTAIENVESGSKDDSYVV